MKVILLAAFLCIPFGSLHALDIPLGGFEGGGGARIGFVDMERIFETFPQTKLAKEDYARELEKRRELLKRQEDELRDIRNRITVLEGALQGSPPEAFNGEEEGGVSWADPAVVEVLREQLRKKEADFDDARRRAEQDLASFERRQSQIILGQIYQALTDVAQEAQVSLVVDKASVLFGAADVDLTERLQERVRGF